MPEKSKSCFNKKGEPRAEYYSEYEAQSGADYEKITHGADLVPYKCSECDKWHLSPKNRQTPSITCNYCKDSKGNYKELYATEEIARQRAKILEEEQGIKLRIYPCDHNHGYHLTKNI